MPTVLTEARHDGGFLVSEADGHRSRDVGTLGGATKFLSGMVLATLAGGAATATAKAGNSGNGVFTLDATTPVLDTAMVGTYIVRCTAAATNGGAFRVFDPSGDVLGDVAVGATFNDQIKFVIADGAVDFIIGDEFDVSVSVLSQTYVQLNPTATDGTKIATGVSFATVDATLSNQPGTILKRDAEVNGSELIWPTGATGAQIAIATAQLAAKGIVLR
jgi:hypothetical protein